MQLEQKQQQRRQQTEVPSFSLPSTTFAIHPGDSYKILSKSEIQRHNQGYHNQYLLGRLEDMEFNLDDTGRGQSTVFTEQQLINSVENDCLYDADVVEDDDDGEQEYDVDDNLSVISDLSGSNRYTTSQKYNKLNTNTTINNKIMRNVNIGHMMGRINEDAYFQQQQQQQQEEETFQGCGVGQQHHQLALNLKQQNEKNYTQRAFDIVNRNDDNIMYNGTKEDCSHNYNIVPGTTLKANLDDQDDPHQWTDTNGGNVMEFHTRNLSLMTDFSGRITSSPPRMEGVGSEGVSSSINKEKCPPSSLQHLGYECSPKPTLRRSVFVERDRSFEALISPRDNGLGFKFPKPLKSLPGRSISCPTTNPNPCINNVRGDSPGLMTMQQAFEDVVAGFDEEGDSVITDVSRPGMAKSNTSQCTRRKSGRPNVSKVRLGGNCSSIPIPAGNKNMFQEGANGEEYDEEFDSSSFSIPLGGNDYHGPDEKNDDNDLQHKGKTVDDKLPQHLLKKDSLRSISSEATFGSHDIVQNYKTPSLPPHLKTRTFPSPLNQPGRSRSCEDADLTKPKTTKFPNPLKKAGRATSCPLNETDLPLIVSFPSPMPTLRRSASCDLRHPTRQTNITFPVPLKRTMTFPDPLKKSEKSTSCPVEKPDLSLPFLGEVQESKQTNGHDNIASVYGKILSGLSSEEENDSMSVSTNHSKPGMAKRMPQIQSQLRSCCQGASRRDSRVLDRNNSYDNDISEELDEKSFSVPLADIPTVHRDHSKEPNNVGNCAPSSAFGIDNSTSQKIPKLPGPLKKFPGPLKKAGRSVSCPAESTVDPPPYVSFSAQTQSNSQQNIFGPDIAAAFEQIMAADSFEDGDGMSVSTINSNPGMAKRAPGSQRSSRQGISRRDSRSQDRFRPSGNYDVESVEFDESSFAVPLADDSDKVGNKVSKGISMDLPSVKSAEKDGVSGGSSMSLPEKFPGPLTKKFPSPLQRVVRSSSCPGLQTEGYLDDDRNHPIKADLDLIMTTYDDDDDASAISDYSMQFMAKRGARKKRARKVSKVDRLPEPERQNCDESVEFDNCSYSVAVQDETESTEKHRRACQSLHLAADEDGTDDVMTEAMNHVLDSVPDEVRERIFKKLAGGNNVEKNSTVSARDEFDRLLSIDDDDISAVTDISRQVMSKRRTSQNKRVVPRVSRMDNGSVLPIDQDCDKESVEFDDSSFSVQLVDLDENIESKGPWSSLKSSMSDRGEKLFLNHAALDPSVTSTVANSSLDDSNTYNKGFANHPVSSETGRSVPTPNHENTKQAAINQATKKGSAVTFSFVEVRSYEPVLDVNPSVTSGAAIAIGWNIFSEERVCLEDLPEEQSFRNPRKTKFPSAADLRIPVHEREDLLRQSGYTTKEIAAAIRFTDKARKNRKNTVRYLKMAKFEEAIETTNRFLKKFFRRLVAREGRKESDSSKKLQKMATKSILRGEPIDIY